MKYLRPAFAETLVQTQIFDEICNILTSLTGMATRIFYRVGTVEIQVYINCGGSRKRPALKIPGGSLSGPILYTRPGKLNIFIHTLPPPTLKLKQSRTAVLVITALRYLRAVGPNVPPRLLLLPAETRFRCHCNDAPHNRWVYVHQLGNLGFGYPMYPMHDTICSFRGTGMCWRCPGLMR